MSIETSYGFRSAQAAWENANPHDGDCDCPQLFQCPECGEYAEEAGMCCMDGDEVVQFNFEPIDREDNTEFALLSCRRHGGCGGCSSSKCGDCN